MDLNNTLIPTVTDQLGPYQHDEDDSVIVRPVLTWRIPTF